MNKNYPCDIIKDLLPGYIDGLLSETGTRAVKEHLEGCAACRKIFEEMAEGPGKEPEEREKLVLDGFKKIHQRTRRLKMTAGAAAGLLFLFLLSGFLRIYVLGTPVSTEAISLEDISYEEEMDTLGVNGKVNWAGYRISKVTWEADEENDSQINILVYGAETLPFQQEQTDWSVSIPDMKGKTAYLACPPYDRWQIYDWRQDHYEIMAELEDQIYEQLPGLDREKDALFCVEGIETVEGTDGILFGVESIVGEGAVYWWSGDQLYTDGELESKDYYIWISLEEPCRILIHDLRTGEYTEDVSIIEGR